MNTATQITGWRSFVAQLGFVFGATLIAGTSERAATIMLAVMVTLGVLWAIGHYGGES